MPQQPEVVLTHASPDLDVHRCKNGGVGVDQRGKGDFTSVDRSFEIQHALHLILYKTKPFAVPEIVIAFLQIGEHPRAELHILRIDRLEHANGVRSVFLAVEPGPYRIARKPALFERPGGQDRVFREHRMTCIDGAAAVGLAAIERIADSDTRDIMFEAEGHGIDEDTLFGVKNGRIQAQYHGIGSHTCFDSDTAVRVVAGKVVAGRDATRLDGRIPNIEMTEGFHGHETAYIPGFYSRSGQAEGFQLVQSAQLGDARARYAGKVQVQRAEIGTADDIGYVRIGDGHLVEIERDDLAADRFQLFQLRRLE